MLDQNTFMETVREVSEIIRTSDRPLTREEILNYFTDMELNEEQQELVFTYLITPHEEPVSESGEDESSEDETAEDTTTDEENEQAAEAGGSRQQDIMPDSKVFSMYLEELQQIPTYSEMELDKLYAGLAEGDEATIPDLSNAWLKNVLELAKELAMSSEDFEDIVQEGNMSLFLKLTELCGHREASRDTDFRKWVEGELQQAVKLAMQTGISELAGAEDSEKAMIGKINLVNEAKRYLAEEKGREPSVEELADYTRMNKDELADILAVIGKAKEK